MFANPCLASVRYKPFQKTHIKTGKRQENDGAKNIEKGMGVRNLLANICGSQLD